MAVMARIFKLENRGCFLQLERINETVEKIVDCHISLFYYYLSVLHVCYTAWGAFGPCFQEGKVKFTFMSTCFTPGGLGGPISVIA